MGKITVEIKKSTFGKPLHNFDHPSERYPKENSITLILFSFSNTHD